MSTKSEKPRKSQNFLKRIFLRPTGAALDVKTSPVAKHGWQHSNISTVFQDYHTFAFSLGENVAFARVDSKNRDHILKSIGYGGLTDIVAKMKRGVDTSVSRILDDSGIELSGGQRQRLAISRAYYHPAMGGLLPQDDGDDIWLSKRKHKTFYLSCSFLPAGRTYPMDLMRTYVHWLGMRLM